MPSLSTFKTDMLYRVQALIGTHPQLYYKLYARRYPFNRMRVDRDTELCIEGFPRSANSYAVVAFKLANPQVRLGHHLHVPAQIIRACKMGLPAVTVIREPAEAVASFLVFQQSLNADLYLQLYSTFYRSLFPHLDKMVIASFEEVTGEFNGIIRRINERFGTHYQLIDDISARKDQIFKRLQEVNRQFFGGEKNKSMYPNADRKRMKEQVQQRIAASSRLSEAEEIYNHYIKQKEQNANE